MDNNNDNFPQIYDSTRDYGIYSEDMINEFNTRYDNIYDNRYYNICDNYDRCYDRDYYRRMRYYQYPYCDRYGRCENPVWWLFWPFFFM